MNLTRLIVNKAIMKPVEAGLRLCLPLLLKSDSLKDLVKNQIKTQDPLTTIYLEYPVVPRPRYVGPHKQLQHVINENRDGYAENLRSFLKYREQLSGIAQFENSMTKTEPYWTNTYLPELDSLALYCLLAIRNPARYFEIGSGNSTKFARRAIKDNNLRTVITSIDPEPRAEVEEICDHTIRQPLEMLDTKIFEELERGDILFVDSSHCVYMNADTTVFFLEVLPLLKPGVIVEMHDIFLPFDYPVEWVDRYYSEQYLLAAYLLADSYRFHIMLPNSFVARDDSLSTILSPLWDALGIDGRKRCGASFWIEMK